MAEPVVDFEAGRLRLGERDLTALAAYADGGAHALGSEDRDRLERAGALLPEGLDPDLEPLAETLARPLVELSLEILHGPQPGSMPGWVSPHAAAIAAPDPDGDPTLREIILVEPTFLAHRLAGMLGVGARPRVVPEGEVAIERSTLDALLDVADEADVRTALGDDGKVPPEAIRALAEMAKGLLLHWRVEAHWTDLAGEAGGRLGEFIDAGVGGVWAVIDMPVEGDVVMLRTSTPTFVWRTLSSILPTDEELTGSDGPTDAQLAALLGGASGPSA